jgi:hypothetical protein
MALSGMSLRSPLAALAGLSRRTLLRRLSAAGAGMLAGMGLSPARGDAHQDPRAVVGIGHESENGFEFAGRLEQRGIRFTILGFVTQIDGFPSPLLFVGNTPFARSVAQARLTVAGTATGTARVGLDTLHIVNASGEISFHFDLRGGASFDDPASFSRGVEIGTGRVEIQSIVNVQEPDRGIVSAFGHLRQSSATPFKIRHQQLTLGREGLQYRLTYTGQGTLLDAQEPHSVIAFAGNGVVPR